MGWTQQAQPDDGELVLHCGHDAFTWSVCHQAGDIELGWLYFENGKVKKSRWLATCDECEKLVWHERHLVYVDAWANGKPSGKTRLPAWHLEMKEYEFGMDWNKANPPGVVLGAESRHVAEDCGDKAQRQTP